ncbi:alpha/beta hydrolase [Nocardia sp. NPDC050378]|uniref:alpha/beta fold hydrolase n=1 Tax=Nocardia sp. NPDC050378 TaxID=3155400 RepID=UPI0033FD1C9D
MSQLVNDLDSVLAHTTGPVVLVVHSLAAVVVQEWLYRHRRDEHLVDAIVAVAPIPELPDHIGAFDEDRSTLARQAGRRWIHDLANALGSSDRVRGDVGVESARRTLRCYRRCGADLAVVEDLLRATPTWIVTGTGDQLANPTRVDELASTVWAELHMVTDAGHGLVGTHPQAVARVVTDALDAVFEYTIYGGDR